MHIRNCKESCSGCTACEHSCPYGAIRMAADEEGFLYPEVDESQCTHCGICVSVCPFHPDKLNQSIPAPAVYAVKHKDDEVRMSSSSGGAFSAISDYVLESDGVVYGAAYGEKFQVQHIKAMNKEERNQLKGSKYVQSYLGNVFPEIRLELKRGKIVLFTGTPCQTAGLRAFLQNDNTERLILCDVVCSGVPSPLIWEEYLALIQNKVRAGLKDFRFRHKRKGWHSSRVYTEFADGETFFDKPLINIFSHLFAQHLADRPSCQACVYTNFSRPSDLTLADFWGIEQYMPAFDDNKGVSLVLVNTKKGKEVFERIKKDIIYEKSNVSECKHRNLKSPTKPSPRREKFWQDYWEHGFEYVAKKYTEYGSYNRFKKYYIRPLYAKLGLRR